MARSNEQAKVAATNWCTTTNGKVEPAAAAKWKPLRAAHRLQLLWNGGDERPQDRSTSETYSK